MQLRLRLRGIGRSSQEPKNHRPLITAWCLLASEGLFPSLCLTVSNTDYVELFRWIERVKEKYKLCVDNVGAVSQQQVRALYRQAQALIYSSSFESFGLPQVETKQVGLPVLASELDYVLERAQAQCAF